MSILITGSAGHLGEGLVRRLRAEGTVCAGLDIKPSEFTDHVASITDRAAVRAAMAGKRAVIHAAALHKPHIATHAHADFVAVNVAGTLLLLEEAAEAGVTRFVHTSTTSAFGAALKRAPDEPAGWITEDLPSVAKNIYGVTKSAAENLCEMFARQGRLSAIVLRTARFFPEMDDDPEIRGGYDLANVQANEMLYRRADLEDVVEAHLAAVKAAPRIGFGRYIVSATTPFGPGDLARLGRDAGRAVMRHFPDYAALYAARGWRMFPRIDRVYVNERARAALDWRPRHDFRHVLDCLKRGEDFRSPLARAVGEKGYHDRRFAEGPYPV
jgi:UDP-glucose 4-epimerase